MKNLNAIQQFIKILKEELETQIDFGPTYKPGALFSSSYELDELKTEFQDQLNDALLRAAGVKK